MKILNKTKTALIVLLPHISITTEELQKNCSNMTLNLRFLVGKTYGLYL